MLPRDLLAAAPRSSAGAVYVRHLGVRSTLLKLRRYG